MKGAVRKKQIMKEERKRVSEMDQQKNTIKKCPK
jgi:hypothetical protein